MKGQGYAVRLTFVRNIGEPSGPSMRVAEGGRTYLPAGASQYIDT